MPAGAAVLLSGELSEFVQSGVSIMFATRDASLRPACVRAQGARLGADRTQLTILLPEALMEKSLANLRDNGQVAVFFSRATTHRSFQIKGTCVAIRPGDLSDRECQERYRLDWSADLETVGVPRATTYRVRYWPSVAVDVRIREVFVQTPGPEAGRPL